MTTTIAVEELANNYLAGLNQADRTKDEITELVTNILTKTILNNENCSIDTARYAFIDGQYKDNIRTI